jgi:hypothetical protein
MKLPFVINKYLQSSVIYRPFLSLSVAIAQSLQLHVPGLIPGMARFISSVYRPDPPSSYAKATRSSFPGGRGRGMKLTNHLHILPK